MLIMQAEELSCGDRIFQHTGWDFHTLTFLAGPFKNENDESWFLVAKNSNGEVGLFNLNEVSIKSVEPKAEQTWHRNSADVIIIEVTPRFVIYRGPRASNQDAMVMTKEGFVHFFRHKD